MTLNLFLVFAVLILSGLHDFIIGPAATAAGKADPGSAYAGRLRRDASWMGRMNLVLALVVTAIGVMLVRGRP